MVTFSFSPLTSSTVFPHLFLFHPKHTPPANRVSPSRTFFLPRFSAASGGINYPIPTPINHNQPRSLFPGGYKRPEIRVPNLVLRLSADDVFRDDKTVVDIIDDAVSDRVGIVVLTGGESSDKKLYEAACLLKSVIKDRAYLLIDERVDIAVAVNASGVLLSDQGLPTMVARNTMMGAKSDSMILPLVARNVRTYEAALDASNSEGADFLIYTIPEDDSEDLMISLSRHVKIPIFVTVDSPRDEILPVIFSNSLKSGVGGIIISVDELASLGENGSTELFYSEFSETKGMENGVYGKKMFEEREKQFLDKERSILLEAINIIGRASPLMGDMSLLKDAVSQLDEPFSLVIVGEFNTGKSSVINAFLGQSYLKDGVVPTTARVTFLRYSDSSDFSEQRCERHPDGQYICYIPAPVLKDMIIVDTPGTNVILQSQQRLTEEFVPRADLILFVLSADRPFTESEVAFLRYIQKWKKKIVFVLNKCDLYRTADELEEAIAFIKENIRKMLNEKHVTLYTVSARNALETKLSGFNVLENQEQFSNDPRRVANNFLDLEKYLYSFLDISTSNGIERIKLKLQTPVKIAEQLLYSRKKLVTEELQQAEHDLVTVNNVLSTVKEYALKMENESIYWKRQVLSLISNTQAGTIKLAESTLQLSNLDLVTSYIFKGDKSSQMPVTSRLRNEIIDPALSQAQKLLGEYSIWLHSNNGHKGNTYKELFKQRWPSVVPSVQSQFDTCALLSTKHELGVTVLDNFNAATVSKLFEQEIREVLLSTFGGLGAAGLSASLLTSILPTTLEDLLALGLCSAGGLLVISRFSTRRQKVIDKVRKNVDEFACKLDEAMEKDLSDTIDCLNIFVALIGEPYQELGRNRVNKLSATLDELNAIEGQLKTLQIEIQNLHVSK